LWNCGPWARWLGGICQSLEIEDKRSRGESKRYGNYDIFGDYLFELIFQNTHELAY
jgi:hypothetical protein